MLNRKVGFTLVEGLVIVASIVLVFLILHPAIIEREKRIRDTTRAVALEQILTTNGLDSTKPIDLGEGWYYVGTNAMDALLHYPPLGFTNISSVSVFSTMTMNQSATGIKGSEIISWVSNNLNISQGRFVYIEFCKPKTGKGQLEKVR